MKQGDYYWCFCKKWKDGSPFMMGKSFVDQPDLECFECGEPYHISDDWPKKGKDF